jgi:Ca-activated chloride channel homolog
MNPLLEGVSGTFLNFRDPWFLCFILLLPLVYWWEKRKSEPSVIYPTLERVRSIRASLKLRLFPLRLGLRLTVLFLLILGVARFQKGRKSIEVITHGVDIILAVDTSGSMKAEDFRLDSKRTKRLDAVKRVVSDFVLRRESDRLGMVVFGSMAFTQCPLTLDHGVFLSFLRNLEIGMAGEQTAIGSAIGTGVNRLKNLNSKSKVMILLTDGANTAGDMDPLQAAEIARAFGIKIYTIGVGSKGEAPFLVQTIFGPQYQYARSDLNEDVLRKIADLTSGKYYRAQDTEELQRIYTEIDALETSKAKLKEHMEYRELYSLFVIPAFLLLGLERILDWTWFRRTP